MIKDGIRAQDFKGDGSVEAKGDDSQVITLYQMKYDGICRLFDTYGTDEDEELVSYVGENAIPVDSIIGDILLNHPGIQIITSVAREFGIDELYVHGSFCDSVFIGTKIPCVPCGSGDAGVIQRSDGYQMSDRMVYTQLMNDIDIAILLPPTVSSAVFFEAVHERSKVVDDWNYEVKEPAVDVAPGKPHTLGITGYERISGDRGEISWVPKLDVHFVGVDEGLTREEKHDAISEYLDYILPAHSQMALELNLVNGCVHLVDKSGRFFHGVFQVVPDVDSNQFQRLENMSKQVIAGETVEVDWELYYAMELIHRMLKIQSRSRKFISVEKRIQILKPIRDFIIACEGNLTSDEDRTGAFWRRASDSFAQSLAGNKMRYGRKRYAGDENDPFSLGVGYDEYQVPMTIYPVFDLLFPGFRDVLGGVANLPIDEVNQLTYQYFDVVMDENGVVDKQSVERVKALFRLQVFAQFTRSITVMDQLEPLRIDNINKYLVIVLLSCYFADLAMCVTQQDQQEVEAMYNDVSSFFTGNRWSGEGEVVGLNVPEEIVQINETDLPRFGKSLDIASVLQTFERLKDDQMIARYRHSDNIRKVKVEGDEGFNIFSGIAWARVLTDQNVIGMLKLVLEEDEQK